MYVIGLTIAIDVVVGGAMHYYFARRRRGAGLFQVQRKGKGTDQQEYGHPLQGVLSLLRTGCPFLATMVSVSLVHRSRARSGRPFLGRAANASTVTIESALQSGEAVAVARRREPLHARN